MICIFYTKIIRDLFSLKLNYPFLVYFPTNDKATSAFFSKLLLFKIGADVETFIAKKIATKHLVISNNGIRFDLTNYHRTIKLE